MRRQDRQLSAADGIAILKQNNYGVLSLVGGDNLPYGVPINYAYYNNTLILHAAITGKKLDALRHQPQVSFCVVDKSALNLAELTTHYASTIVTGQAKIIDNDSDKRAYLSRFLQFYQIDNKQNQSVIDRQLAHTAVIVIAIDQISAKGNVK